MNVEEDDIDMQLEFARAKECSHWEDILMAAILGGDVNPEDFEKAKRYFHEELGWDVE